MRIRLVIAAGQQLMTAVEVEDTDLSEAAALIGAWETAGLRLPRVIVPASARELAAVAGALARGAAAVSAERLALAIPVGAVAGLRDQLVRLRSETGVHVEITNVGADASDFDRLVELPADLVTLAPGLTARAGVDAEADDVIGQACGFAHELGWTTQATGVRDPPHRAALAAEGVDELSGPAFGDWIPEPQLGAAVAALGVAPPPPARRIPPVPARPLPPEHRGPAPSTVPGERERRRPPPADRQRVPRPAARSARRPPRESASGDARRPPKEPPPPRQSKPGRGGVSGSHVVGLLLFAALVVGALGWLGFVGSPFSDDVQDPIAAVPVGRSLEQQGFNLTAWSRGDYNTTHATGALNDASDLGANAVSIVVTEYVDDVNSTDIHPVEGKTPSKFSVKRIARVARRQGYYVTIKPHVDTVSGDWRGEINPQDFHAFADSYLDFIDKYANVAQDVGARELIVGTELKAISARMAEDQAARLVGFVRERFDGSVGWAANWDEIDLVPWQLYDFIGIDAYYPLANTTDVNALVQSWEPYKQHAIELSHQYGKPLIFTEAGYQNKLGATETPWNAPADAALDDQTQIAGLQAMFTAWSDVPELQGIYLWQLYGGNPADLDPGDWTVIGKPAEDVVEQAYDGGA